MINPNKFLVIPNLGISLFGHSKFWVFHFLVIPLFNEYLKFGGTSISGISQFGQNIFGFPYPSFSGF